MINVLQLIFDQFDLLVDTFKVQKVRKTVNEYYMTAAGLPDRELIGGEQERAKATAALAFGMVNIMDIINMELQQHNIHTDPPLQLQVGINTGTAIAGVIGHKRFQYDLCGDAVNTAARMCAKSAPGCITVSHATAEMLGAEYETIYRGEHAVKGKGSMQLYYLVGRTNETLQEARTAPAAAAPPALCPPPPRALRSASASASASASGVRPSPRRDTGVVLPRTISLPGSGGRTSASSPPPPSGAPPPPPPTPAAAAGAPHKGEPPPPAGGPGGRSSLGGAASGGMQPSCESGAAPRPLSGVGHMSHAHARARAHAHAHAYAHATTRAPSMRV